MTGKELGKELKLLSEEILEKYGSFERVRQYWKDWHPEIPNAVLIFGLTGKETMVEKDVIRPVRTFVVYEGGGKNDR